jgi:hypothetical protein
MIKNRANALMKLEEAYAAYWGNPCKIPGYDPDRILDDVEMYKKVLDLAEKRESTDESSDEETKKSSTTPTSSLRRKKKKKLGNTTFFKGLVEPKFNIKKAKSRRPTVRIGGLFGLFGQKVDAIEYYTKLFDDLDKTVIERRRSPNYEITNVAFVTFEHMSSAVSAHLNWKKMTLLTIIIFVGYCISNCYQSSTFQPPYEYGIRTKRCIMGQP